MKTKNHMRCTSLQAFEQIIPELENREMQVLIALNQLGMANNLMISKFLNLPVNCITGRIYSLRSLGLVIYYKKDKCPYTGKNTIMWKVKNWISDVMVKK